MAKDTIGQYNNWHKLTIHREPPLENHTCRIIVGAIRGDTSRYASVRIYDDSIERAMRIKLNVSDLLQLKAQIDAAVQSLGE